MTGVAATGVSLRRTMLFGALALGAMMIASTITFFLVSASIRGTIDASAEQQIVEQQVADQIVSSSYSQQLIAYRYLEAPSDMTLRQFRERGSQAYDGIRRYLFRQMPVSARLKVEAIKEAHQNFEVTAERAFDLAKTGQASAARARIAVLSTNAATLEEAVRGFVAERADQRRALRAHEEAMLTRLERMTGAVRIAVALATILFMIFLRQRVLVPLEDLTTVVRQLGTETDDVRMRPQRYREFQLLAAAFNGMADHIQSSQDEIWARNEQLTQTLEELRRAQQELVQREKLSAMGEMLAGLAHELNNPLGGILGMAECMKAELSDSSDPKLRELLDTMVEPLVTESFRARDLVMNLLNFSRRSTMQLESVQLAEAVDVAVGLRRHAFVLAQKRVETDVPPGLYVTAQSQKLQYAVINILNNALDAIGNGAGTRVAIAARAEEDAVVLTLHDDGPGFRNPARVFDPFYTTKGVGKGTGLGLSLVHQFVEEFGGTIVADNAPDGGARLTIRLERALAPAVPRATPPVTNVVRPRSTTSSLALTPSKGVAAVNQRLLIVDDEPALRSVQQRMLADLAVDIETAASGAEACQAIKNRHFDLVITDLRMPGGMDGRDLVAWIERERPSLAEHVLVVTGDVTMSGPMGASPVSADRVLTKPFARAEYLDRVRRALAVAGSRAAATHVHAA